MSTNSTLITGIRNARNVLRYLYGRGAITDLAGILAERRGADSNKVIFFIDSFFRQNGLPQGFNAIKPGDQVIFVDTTDEPTTTKIDQLCEQVLNESNEQPCAIVGIGGGITMDAAKAVSNLLTNGGRAEDYQGWDLVKVPGVHKIGVPTISGTGAEATRTCVMTNTRSGLKLGMNSDYTVFDHLILDPDLTASVPRDQYFYSGMDAYIHCIESTAGRYRNAVGDAYSRETINLCRQVFLADDMMNPESRERLMVASYLGGCAIAASYVGVVHPFSAGLSVVLGLHHCVANCIVMRAMGEFYPVACGEFFTMVDRQQVSIPEGVCRGLSDVQHRALYDATVIHEKPLTNALGSDYRKVLTFDKVVSLFQKM